MLFGNLIFIKKTGGDGSKYPVTEKNIKIGRSEECLIRIYNPQVAQEHCQLIIDDNGQAKLRNFSIHTILNGKPLVQGDMTLCHGDIFKLGERLVRWEYLPSSKYYKQLLSPSGRLVAVVMPQQRSAEEQIFASTSTSRSSLSKSTPVGGKRRYSERVITDFGSGKKISKISSTGKTSKGAANVTKFLSGRHSLQSAKMLFTQKAKQRRSALGSLSSKPQTPQKARKSTLPLWKVNLVSPQSGKKMEERKSPGNKTPTSNKSTETLVKSLRKSTAKSPVLKTVSESQPKQTVESPRSTRSLSKSPSVKAIPTKMPSAFLSSTPARKSTPKSVRLVNSERKVKSTSKKNSGLAKDSKRLSLILKSSNRTPRKSLLKGVKKNLSKLVASPKVSVKSPTKRSSRALDSNVLIKTPVGSVSNKSESISKVQTPTKSSLVMPERNSSAKKSVGRPKKTPKKVASPLSTNKTPERLFSAIKESPLRRVSSSSSKKSQRETPAVEKPLSTRKSQSPKKEKSPAVRAVKRKLSPSISSAERAAKKLKTSSPRKPDKNKKAALLVLGKANRKQINSQNVKVLLKQKIVKKAIKQSTLPPIRKDDKVSHGKVKISKKKNAAKRKKKSGKKSSSAEKPAAAAMLEVQNTSVVKSPISAKIKLFEEETPKVRKSFNESFFNRSCHNSQSSSGSPSKVALLNEKASLQSPAKQTKISTSSRLSASPSKMFTSKTSPAAETSKVSDNYFIASSRRCSKRLSSKNNTSRPDYMELSPTALGLMPKNIEVFKTPKEIKRRSLSLVTPKNNRKTGIIKSASTSKITNRKSVRFSSKEISFGTPNTTQGTEFDFESIQTPNLTLDVIVSPLLEESLSSALKNTSSLRTLSLEEMKEGRSPKSPKFSLKSTHCVRKLLQSPQQSPKKDSPLIKKVGQSPKLVKSDSAQLRNAEKKLASSNVSKSPKGVESVRQMSSPSKIQKSPKKILSDVGGIKQLLRSPRNEKSPKNELPDFRGVKRLLKTPKAQKSPKNDLTNVRGVKRLLKTPKVQKSPKNDLSDVQGVKELLKTPKVQKSPKNDLSDVQGVKKLLKTPKVQKSPKNDLSDVQGVKKLLKTPKVQKSPKNDLSDVQGVKKLLKTPKVQKSPKNDLTDIQGVKKLLRTPKMQKSPKNDLSDVRGVKQLLRTPKLQKSPKNDLTDVQGVKKLLKTPKVQKSPKNDLSDVRGVKKLLQTPKVQKSPKNDLSDLRGVKQLMRTPRQPKSPRNDLSDVVGVKQLLRTPPVRKSPKNELTDLRGVKRLLNTPRGQKSPKNDLSDLRGVRQLLGSPKPRKSPRNDLMDVSGVGEIFNSPKAISDTENVQIIKTPQSLRMSKSNTTQVSGVKQLLIAKSPPNVSKSKKSAIGKSRLNVLKSIRGRRTIYSTPKGPKNDLSDLTGVRELFSRHKPTNDLDISYTGVAELFDLPTLKTEADGKLETVKTLRKKSVGKALIESKVIKTPGRKSRKISEDVKVVQENETVIPRNRTKKAVAEVGTRTTRSRNVKSVEEVSSKAKTGKLTKRKVVEKVRSAEPKKISRGSTKSHSVALKETKTRGRGLKTEVKSAPLEETNTAEIKPTRKRKITSVDSGPSPPKLRRRQVGEPIEKKLKKETTQSGTSNRRQVKKLDGSDIEGKSSEISKGIKTSKKVTTSKVQTKASRTTSKTGEKSVQKVQKGRSRINSKQSASEEKVSPRKTRSVKVGSQEKVSKVQIKKVGKKTATAKKKVSPVVKRSTRRK